MLIWHYTVGIHAEKIVAEGVIRPDLSVHGSRPVTWFSANTSYEPTARKVWGSDQTKPRLLSVEECDELCRGLYRFGIPRTHALPWRKCCARARIEEGERVALEAVGREQGARPGDWYGVLGAVLLSDVQTVERWHAGQWIAVRGKAAND